MPTITRTFKVTTDASGAFEATQTFNPPGPFGFTVELRAKLVAPADTTLSGELDCDAANGNTQNDAQNFSISSGETANLGKWRLSGGDNIIRIAGQTDPAQPDTEVEIEVAAEI